MALGFLEITQRGGRSISEYRNPSRYRLTYVNGRGMSAIKTEEWKRIASADAATAALQRAAEEKNHNTQATRRMAMPRPSRRHWVSRASCSSSFLRKAVQKV